jgi:hypothetical protein
MHKGERRFNGMTIILDGSFLSRLAFGPDPPFKLMSKGSGMRTQDNPHAEANFFSNGLRHVHRVQIGCLMPLQRFRRRCEIGAMNQHYIGAACPLKLPRCVQKQPSAVEVEMVVKNWAIIDHGVPSNPVDEKPTVVEYTLPVHGSHGHHVWVAGISHNALAVRPNLNGEAVAGIGEGGATETSIKFGGAGRERCWNGIKLHRSIKLERDDDRTHLSHKTTVVHAHAQKELFSSSTGCFYTMSPMDHDASFFIHHQGRPWAFHGFDDNTTVPLPTDLRDDSVVVEGSRTDKADKLILDANIH